MKHTKGTTKVKETDSMHYYPRAGERVDVVVFIQYPSYDFIFGTVPKENPKSKTEVAFFQYRDTRHKHVNAGFYLDQTELDEMALGFSALRNAVKK